MIIWSRCGGVAPAAAPKADATGMAPKKSARNPLVTPEGFLSRGRPGRRGGSPRTLLPAAKRRRAPLLLRGRAARRGLQAASTTT